MPKRYITQVIWPPFKGKAHKVIDTETGRGVGLYKTPAGANRKANALNAAITQPRPDYDPRVDYPERYAEGRPI